MKLVPAELIGPRVS